MYYYVLPLQFILQFGEDHYKTKESSECLKELTGKAVSMQKTVSVYHLCVSPVLYQSAVWHRTCSNAFLLVFQINEMTSKGGNSGKLLFEPLGSWGDVACTGNATTEKGQLTKTKTQ